MMTRQIQCRCGTVVPVPSDPGAEVRCPSCHAVHTLTPPGPIPGSVAVPAPAPAARPIIHTCPSCGQQSRVQATMVGRAVRCPHCKSPGTVAGPAPPPPPGPAPSQPAPRPDPLAGLPGPPPGREEPDPLTISKLDFATEQEAPLTEGEPPPAPAASDRKRKPTSGLQNRPASGFHRSAGGGRTKSGLQRPTRTQSRERPVGGAPRRPRASGVYRRTSAEVSPAEPGKAGLWLALGAAVLVLLIVLVGAAIFLIQSG